MTYWINILVIIHIKSLYQDFLIYCCSCIKIQLSFNKVNVTHFHTSYPEDCLCIKEIELFLIKMLKYKQMEMSAECIKSI